MAGLLVAFAFACNTSSTDVSCSPTLTCTVNDERFDPPAIADAGLLACGDIANSRCAANTIAAGGTHSCALTDAELFCWGDTGLERSTFTREPILANKVATGSGHGCVLDSDGFVSCFGRNDRGQVLGTPSSMRVVLAPVQLGRDRARDVDAGARHSCAILRDGVWCWGDATYGQSGREVSDRVLAPGLVPGTERAIEVATGVRHTCALFENGEVSCWGELYDEGADVPRARAEPTPIAGTHDAIALTAGAGHACAIDSEGFARCWGANESGQLGDGSTVPSATPVAVAFPQSTRALWISAGGGERDGALAGFTCAVDSFLFVQCWGRNTEGQLGDGTPLPHARPALVSGRVNRDELYLGDAVRVDAGEFHACALDGDGPVACWGDDSSHQLGAANEGDVLFGRPVRVSRFSRR